MCADVQRKRKAQRTRRADPAPPSPPSAILFFLRTLEAPARVANSHPDQPLAGIENNCSAQAAGQIDADFNVGRVCTAPAWRHSHCGQEVCRVKSYCLLLKFRRRAREDPQYSTYVEVRTYDSRETTISHSRILLLGPSHCLDIN